MVKSGQLTNIVDSVSTTNQQNLSTIKNVDLRKSHPHQQNWSIVQIVDSLLDPNQQSVSLKIGETTKCTLGFFLHNNKFVDQQSGSNVQIVVSGPTSTNCVIPNLPRGSRQLYLPITTSYRNLDQNSTSKSCANFSLNILTKLQLQNLNQTSAITGAYQYCPPSKILDQL